MMKISNRFLCCFIALMMVALLCACQEKAFYEYDVHDVVGSNRDSYSKKISAEFFMVFQRSDLKTEIYWISSTDCNKAVAHAVNSVDRVLICSGFFDKYSADEANLYFFDTKLDSVTIVDKDNKTIETMLSSELDSFETIVWYKV